MSQKGGLDLDEDKRMLMRRNVQVVGAPIVEFVGLEQEGGASSVIPQPIVTVDSVLLVTQCVLDKPQDNEKKYHAVWSRVEQGTYCTDEV